MFGSLILLAVIAGTVGITAAGAAVFGIVYAARRGAYALQGKPYRPLLTAGNGYEHQDIDNGANEASIRSIFKRYLQTSGVSKYARSGITALDSAERKTVNFHAILDNKFEPGSITWEKFSVAATAAREGVLRNCAELANAIQAFDHADYRRLEQMRRRSLFITTAQLDATQQEQWRLYQVKLSQMQSIENSTEKLLLELDKLAAELDKLDDVASSTESERLVEEIRQLTEETKYYKQGLEAMDLD